MSVQNCAVKKGETPRRSSHADKSNNETFPRAIYWTRWVSLLFMVTRSSER